MAGEDAATTRMVRRELCRRRLDDSKLQVNAMHGIVYLRGELRSADGKCCDMAGEMVIIQRILRSRPGVRDVIFELYDSSGPEGSVAAT